MNRKILVIAVALMAVAMLATPVMAIGPFGALDKNPKFTLDPLGGLVLSNEGGVSITWVAQTEGPFWMEWRWYDASSGGGKAEKAILFTIATLGQFAADEEAYANGEPTVNENKWIFVSPDVKFTHKVYGEHGMVWWLFYIISDFNLATANNWEAAYPEGAFWKYNFLSFTR